MKNVKSYLHILNLNDRIVKATVSKSVEIPEAMKAKMQLYTNPLMHYTLMPLTDEYAKGDELFLVYYNGQYLSASKYEVDLRMKINNMKRHLGEDFQYGYAIKILKGAQ